MISDRLREPGLSACLVAETGSGSAVAIQRAGRGGLEPVLTFEDPFSTTGVLQLFREDPEYFPARIVETVDGYTALLVRTDGRHCVEWDFDEAGTYLDQRGAEVDDVATWSWTCACPDWTTCPHATLSLIGAAHPQHPLLRDALVVALSVSKGTGAAPRFHRQVRDTWSHSGAAGLGRWAADVLESGELIDVVLARAPLVSMMRPFDVAVGKQASALLSRTGQWFYRRWRAPGLDVVAMETFESAFRFAESFLTTECSYGSLDVEFRDSFTEALSWQFGSLASGDAWISSPLTGQPILSRQSVVLMQPSFPWICDLYEDGINSVAVIRGGGWIGSVKGLLIPRWGRLVVLQQGDAWGDLGSPDAVADLLAAIADAPELVPEPSDSGEKGALIIVPENQNLGHMLWNVASGLCLLRDLVARWSLDRGDLPVMSVRHFRAPGVEDFIRPFSSQFPLEHLTRSAPFGQHESSTQVDGLALMFLAGVCHPDVKEMLRQGARRVDRGERDPRVVRVFVNFRGHNKRWSNIGEALDFVATRLAVANDFTYELAIEYLSDSREEVFHVTEGLGRHGVVVTLHEDLDISELVALLEESHVGVATVGSGLVLPTWFLPMPMVVHGNHNHLSQLRWWASVSASCDPDLMKVIDARQTIQTGDEHYGNYAIEPEAFWRALLSAIQEFRRGGPRRDRQSANELPPSKYLS